MNVKVHVIILMLAWRRACSSSTSFLAKAAAAKDPSALLGTFTSAGCFDAVLAGNLDTLSIGPEGVECALTVTPDLTNNYGTLHGGVTATLVDVVGTLALLGRDPLRPGVSVEMCAAHSLPVSASHLHPSASPSRASTALLCRATRPLSLARRNQSFCSAAAQGDRLLVAGSVLRYGRTLGFTEVSIRRREEDGTAGRLVAVGRHTKFFPP